MSVDLPEPESPMTTEPSAVVTSNEIIAHGEDVAIRLQFLRAISGVTVSAMCAGAVEDFPYMRQAILIWFHVGRRGLGR